MHQKTTFNRWLALLYQWVGKNICNPKVFKTCVLVFKILITFLRLIERIISSVLWFFYYQSSPYFRLTER
jgi:hypothetical protein